MMILNVSYNNREIKDKIKEQVGRPFRLMDKIRNGYYGSQRFLIMQCSQEIENLLKLDNNLNHCNIELRDRGIIVRFRSILNTYGWIIPYEKLQIFNYTNYYALFAEEHFVKIKPAHNELLNHTFFQKLNDLKDTRLKHLPTQKIN
ncbi:MAG: hypothetical protein P8100_04150 [bacterium]